ncbi:MAG: DsbA family protein [bacterium]|nr:DsbA family protein [bacterium]
MEQHKNNFLIPLSIILAGAFIAGALIFVKAKDPSTNVAGVAEASRPEENMLPVTSADHILGNPNAPVMIVEYSDTDCPFCQQFSPTLHRLMDEYAKDGKVAWVYRHFAFHPNAPKEAEAMECVAELGGNEKFWEFEKIIYAKKDFTVTPYKGMDPKELPKMAESIGVNKVAFNSCLESGKYKQKITDEYQNAIKAGAQGTPYTILVTKNGKVPINRGAVPYETLKTAIQQLLNENPE